MRGYNGGLEGNIKGAYRSVGHASYSMCHTIRSILFRALPHPDFRSSELGTGATSKSQIFSINPYGDHANLTQIEADVLWEYAKLNQHIKDVRYPPPQPVP